MPATFFDGVNDAVLCAPGLCGPASLAHSLVIGFRRNTINQWQAMMGAENATRTTVLSSLELNNQVTNPLLGWSDSGSGGLGTVTTSPGTNVTDYFAYGCSRSAGASNISLHMANLTTGATPAHELQGAGATWTGTATAYGLMVFGEWAGADDLNGWLAFGAYYGYRLSDTGFNAAVANKRTTDLMNPNGEGAPLGVWEFNAATVTDLTGNGANESSRVGTSLDAAETPPWTFGLATAAAVTFAPHRMPLGV